MSAIIKSPITYEDIIKQDELLDQFPSESASPEEVQEWILEYRKTFTFPGYKGGLTDAIKKWNGYDFNNLEIRHFQVHFSSLGSYFMKAVIAGKMRREIANARRSRDYFKESAEIWAEELKLVEADDKEYRDAKRYKKPLPASLAKW